ncbi:PTS 2-O-a-mannosyl-D-glycerate transporter subunit IIABC [Streptococcus uberis]|uniref:PTS 2-O-a-mannosyl-D-glycerate transporter subunit IIABC n=1 Tax=Streptococcus uberis TaxID=1349 RepID=UPI001FF1C2C9|nr:PTS 2-O-a-mannosyl-D-glycerate transporter subunit IIABC [Streptococcus uberis]MCK1222879.1 PTS 2-O-a-mannosyl-D-glycerate transporter subunit IIABC [Streptococcus uberis]
MNLAHVTSENLIFLNQNLSTKDEIFNFVSNEFERQGIVSSAQIFKDALFERENMGTTGFENGLAIPHGKSSSVLRPAFSVVRLLSPLSTSEYHSLNETNEVDTLFVLAIPEDQAGNNHLTLLAELATKLGNENYLHSIKNAKTSSEVLSLLSTEENEIKENSSAQKGLILGITACAAGIAHTYMAAEALIRKGNELGYQVKIEKQGANGIEDRITSQEAQNAIGIVLAHDVALKDLDRFKHLPKIDVKVAEPIKNPTKVIDNLIEKSRDYQPSSEMNVEKDYSNEKQDFWTIVKDSVLTGISHIIPIIIAGGMIGAIAVMITQIFGLQELMAAPTDGTVNTYWLFLLKGLGGSMLSVLMPPILAGYMAYSIADKPGLAPGFAAGLAATTINSGFLGAMLGGLVAGFLMKWMKEHIKTNGVLKGFVTFWVYPVVGTLITALIMLFVFGKPVAWLNSSLLTFLENTQNSNPIILGAIIGAMVSFDLGGPVNKAAYAFCIGAMASGNFIPYAIFASVKMVSAFSLTAATALKKNIWTPEEKEIGGQTWILGLAGITEGAIPVAMNDPLRVLGSFVIGSMVTGAMVASANIGLNVPGAGIFSLALLQSSGSKLVAAGIWFGAAVIGAAVSTVLLIVSRQKKLKK